MIKNQTFDHLIDRPFEKRAADVGSGLELQGAGCGQFHRTADPQVPLHRRMKRVAAQAIIEQDAETRSSVGDLAQGFEGEHFEGADPLVRPAGALDHVLEQGTVVDGQRHDRFMVFAAGRRPVNVVEFLIEAQGLVRASLGEKTGKLLPGRNGRGAAVAGHGEGDKGVGVFGAGLWAYAW